MIDVDHFKQINDRYGHATGDSVLKEIAASVKRNLRTYDLLARLGGDEFAIILPEVGFQDAYRVAEKIRTGAAQLLFPGLQTKITTSIGIACYPLHHVSNVEGLMKKADVALYKAKQLGRNNCFFYGQQEMLELFGAAAIEGAAAPAMTISTLLQRLDKENNGEISEEIDFVIGKSIEVLKELEEQINHLKIMVVQMNNQIHQLDPRSTKIKEVMDMLLKLSAKEREVEGEMQDYAQMLKDLPLGKE